MPYLAIPCCRKNAPWIFVQNPYAKETDGDLFKAFQLWKELKQQHERKEVRITAERVKGMHLILWLPISNCR